MNIRSTIARSLFSLAALSTAGAALAAPGPLLPVTVTLKPERVFIPPGFDNNDNAQLVVSGRLANTCFKSGQLKARVDAANHKIYLQQEALQYTDCWCAELPSSYTNTVDLGRLEAGRYEVVAAAGGKQGRVKAGVLQVAATKTATPDEQVYAPVEEAVIRTEAGTAELTLRGTFGSTCANLQEIKVMERTPGVIEVLPISDLREGTRCTQGEHSYEQNVTLPVKGPQPTLVHIRSLSGNSINRVISLR